MKTQLACRLLHFLTVLLLTFAATGLHAAEPAVLDGEAKRQTIEGFGTCIVSWGKASQERYTDELARIYVEDLGFNMLRVNVAPWGYPRTDKVEDISWKKITLDKENSRVKVFLDFAKKLKTYDPDIRLVGTVWSPPAWMKDNNNVTGKKGRKGQEPGIQGNAYKGKKGESMNRLKKEYYPHFAKLLVEMCKLHTEEGVPFYAMSPGNEVMFSQRFESCVWTAEDFATIIGVIGETFEREGFGNVLLFGPETMTAFNWSIANPLYIKELRQNATAWKHFDRFATHGYVDGFKEDTSANSSAAFWKQIKDLGKPYWMTEGGTGGHDWPEPISGIAAAVHNSLVAGNASAFVPWQVAGGRNHHAIMPVEGKSKKTYAMMHFSHWIDAGAVRLAIEGGTDEVQASAYLHEKNGRLTVVVINPLEETRTLNLKLKGLDVASFKAYRTSVSEDHAAIDPVGVLDGVLALAMPAQSIVTLLAEGL